MSEEFGIPEVSNPNLHPVGGEIRVKQSEEAETDINLIVRRHQEMGVPIFPDARARYGDFSGFSDYHDSMNRLMDAQEEFLQLPPAIRDACQNDVGRFLEMISTKEGREALGAIGLDESAIPAVKEPVVEPEGEGTVGST